MTCVFADIRSKAHMCWGLSTLLSSQDATLQSGATAGRMSLQPGTCT